MEQNLSIPPHKRGRDQFRKYKSVILLLAGFYSLLPLSVRRRKLFRCRGEGKINLVKRYALIKSMAKSCGDNVAIYADTYIMNPQSMALGNNVSIHPMCYLESGNTKDVGISLGSDVSIAHGVTIMATSHNYSDIGIPIKDQGIHISPVVIEDNVWIGAKATILAGVTIKSGCIIGANAVVTHDTEENGVYVGVPARRIKSRKFEVFYEGSVCSRS